MHLYLYGENINLLSFFQNTLKETVGDVKYELLDKNTVRLHVGRITQSAIVKLELTSAQLLKLGTALGEKIKCEVIKESEEKESDAPLEVLDQSVTKLRKALETGDYDLYLQALLEAEQAGKTRKTAVAVIMERIEEV
jgi:hypothetical protein